MDEQRTDVTEEKMADAIPSEEPQIESAAPEMAAVAEEVAVTPELETDGSVLEEVVVAETAVSPPTEEPFEPGTLGQRLIMFIIMLVVLGIDQWTKNIVETNLQLGEVYAPFPTIPHIFRFFHVSNTGAAFGLLPSGGPIFAILAVVVSIFLIYYNHTLPKGQIGFRIVLGLLMGGALGNFADRVRLGHVTDFLDFGAWPVFNVADMSVVAGVIVMGWFTYLEFREEQVALAAAKAAEAQQAQQPHTNTIDEWSTS